MNESIRVTAEPVAEFLARFKSADDIAAECRKRGIKARPRCLFECALAELIRSEFPHMGFVRVDPDNNWFLRPEDRNPYVSVGRFENVGSDDDCEMPTVAAEFAEAFDDGEYEDLFLPGLTGWSDEEEDEGC